MKQNFVPSTSEEARDASNVYANEVAEVQLGQVCVCVGLQDFHCFGALQSQEGAVIMNSHVYLSTFSL